MVFDFSETTIETTSSMMDIKRLKPHERRKRLTEKINCAIQGMSENAQFSLAVAVGVFGILVIFVQRSWSRRLS